jgi:hypothetical protein
MGLPLNLTFNFDNLTHSLNDITHDIYMFIYLGEYDEEDEIHTLKFNFNFLVYVFYLCF